MLDTASSESDKKVLKMDHCQTFSADLQELFPPLSLEHTKSEDYINT